MDYVLERLVIKPTFDCTAHCPTCSLRLKHYEGRRGEETLTATDWETILWHAKRLGCDNLHISGGEPTLYPEFLKLVEMGTGCFSYVNVNTNGSTMTSGLAKQLRNTDLNSITFSLYSHRAEVHDRMRNEPGLYQRALAGIRLLQGAPGLEINMQTLLAGYNLLEFDRLVALAWELGVHNLYVSYLEGDVKGLWLPNAQEIQQFRKETAPRAVDFISRRVSPELTSRAVNAAANIFHMSGERIAHIAEGIYFPETRPACSRPCDFALVLANGEVHPCNGVEYASQPIMGNIHQNTLPELWRGDKWNRFRRERHDWCHRCPVTLHFRIELRKAA